jgi:hypothetical protein
MQNERFPYRDGSLPLKNNWATAQKAHQPGLRIITKGDWYIFPWSSFLCAEGNYSQVTATFKTHQVTFQGEELLPILNALAEQRLLQIAEGDRMILFENPLLQQNKEVFPKVVNIDVKSLI